MNLSLLLVSIAVGSVLAWAGVAVVQRRQQRTLRCIEPYVPAAQRKDRAALLAAQAHPCTGSTQ